MFGLGTTDGSLETAVMVRFCDSFVAPQLIPVRLTDWMPLFSLIVRFATGFSVGGGLLRLVTVTVKVRVIVLFCAWPSLTVTEMVATPEALATGVKLIVPVALGLE